MFRDSIVRTSSLLSFVFGIAMFGALVFLPQYQQLVRGDSATKSGLMMLPMVAGMMLGSVGSGRLVAKIGKYRIFPIIGALLMIVSFGLFSQIAIDTNRALIGLWMGLLGLGLGLVMPILTLAVQNAVNHEEIGTATSTVTFFRSIGSSLGAAIFGAILSNRLAHHMANSLPAGTHASAGIKELNSLDHLPPAVLHKVLDAFALSFADVFLYSIPIALLALAIASFLRDKPLKTGLEPTAE